MNPLRFFMAAIVLMTATQALPLFDADLAASPLMHEVRLNYRGVRKPMDAKI